MRGAVHRLISFCCQIALVALLVAAALSPSLVAQESDQAPAPAATTTQAEPPKSKEINLLKLAIAGGIFMIPIAGMSILAVTMALDRLLALRQSRVVPSRLVTGLERLIEGREGFSPEKALHLCMRYPSAAANIVGAMLLRVGRPLAEIESAASHTSQREADRLYSNVRWLNMAASLSTMLGLIGTIQGMIMAFHRLTVMDAGTDRTTALADGIYTALVTTFAGLAVAIPALFVSHYLESRIFNLFRRIEELTLKLVPEFEQFETSTAPASTEEDESVPIQSLPGNTPFRTKG